MPHELIDRADISESELEELIQLIPQWISVKDRLPNHRESILVSTSKGQCVCIFVDSIKVNETLKKNNLPQDYSTRELGSFCSQEIRGNILGGVTHWMPLPEPPKLR